MIWPLNEFLEKIAKKIPERGEGGAGQSPFENFPEFHPFYRLQASPIEKWAQVNIVHPRRHRCPKASVETIGAIDRWCRQQVILSNINTFFSQYFR